MRTGLKIDQESIQRSLREARDLGHGQGTNSHNSTASTGQKSAVQNFNSHQHNTESNQPFLKQPASVRTANLTGGVIAGAPKDVDRINQKPVLTPFPRHANLTAPRNGAENNRSNQAQRAFGQSAQAQQAPIQARTQGPVRGDNKFLELAAKRNGENSRAHDSSREESKARVSQREESDFTRPPRLNNRPIEASRVNTPLSKSAHHQAPKAQVELRTNSVIGRTLSGPGRNEGLRELDLQDKEFGKARAHSHSSERRVRISSSPEELIARLRDSLADESPKRNFIDIHLSRSLPAIEHKLFGPSFTQVLGILMGVCVRPTFFGAFCLSALLLAEGTIAASFFGGDEIARATTEVSPESTHRKSFSLASFVTDEKEPRAEEAALKSRPLIAPPLAVSNALVPVTQSESGSRQVSAQSASVQANSALPRPAAFKITIPVEEVRAVKPGNIKQSVDVSLAVSNSALSREDTIESARAALAAETATAEVASLRRELRLNANEAPRIKKAPNPISNLRYRQELIRFISGVIAVYRPTLPDSGTVAKHIVESSLEEHVDPLFIAAVVATESKFTANARSSAGAMGLMQLMPTTASMVARERGHTKGNLNEPRGNLHLGIHYLKSMIDRYRGSKFLALAAYNWGPGNVDDVKQYGRRIPSSVRDYATTISSRAEAWKRHFASASVIADALEQGSKETQNNS